MKFPMRFPRAWLPVVITGFLVLPTLARAQAAFAGSYAGTFNTRVTAPVVGTIETPSGPYLAVVTAEGAINVSGGVLTGTVSAGGAVTFTGGTGLTTCGIRSAAISGGRLSSEYGELLGNGTTQYRLNPSTSFTPATGGGGGGGAA